MWSGWIWDTTVYLWVYRYNTYLINLNTHIYNHLPSPLLSCVIIPDTRLHCLTLNAPQCSAAAQLCRPLQTDSFLSVSYLPGLHVLSHKDHLSQRCLCLLYEFIWRLSLRSISCCENKTLTFYAWEQLGWTSEWGAFHYSLSVFKSLHSRWLTFLKSFVQNVKAETALCRLHQHPQSLASSSIHSVPLSFSAFSRIRCQTLHRYSHTMQSVGVGGFLFSWLNWFTM